MLQQVRVIPERGEGYARSGLAAPLGFTAEVGSYGKIGESPVLGWSGTVVDGQGQFVGKPVTLCRRHVGSNNPVVAFIYANEDSDDEIFSGICRTKGLK